MLNHVLKVLGWLMILDGMATCLGGRSFVGALIPRLPPGPNLVASFFYAWPELLLRLGGLVQAASGVGLLGASSPIDGH